MSCCLKAEFHAPKLSTSVGNVIIQGGVDVQPLTATENGTYAESGKAFSPVIVDVPNPSTGTITITENGSYDVTEKAEAAVNVQPPLETATVTPTKQTQTVEPTTPNYGLSRVTVDPIPSEYIIPSGTQSIVQNGQYDITDKASVDVQVPQPSGTKQISIIQNGTTTEDVEWVEDAEISVNVPNTYSAADEGKVVNNGALVAQTSRNIVANGTVDTTLNDEVVVNVPNTYTQADEGKVVDNGALVGQTSRNITTNGTVDTTLNNQVVVAVPNSYTQADEGKVVSSGALVSQTSRTVSDNGTYDTTTNNQIVVNNEDYSESLIAFGVTEDLADGIEAMTTYANETTGASDTTLSDAVRTLADGYGGGSADIFTGTFVGNGTTEITIPAPFDPDVVIAYSPNKLTDIAVNATWYYFYGPMVSMSPRRTTSGWGDSASVINLPASNNRPGKTYADGALTLYANGSSIYQFARGARYIFVLARFSVEPRLPEAYQEVSCLICDGGQYIDTGFYPNTTKTRVEIGIMSNSKDVTQGVFGARNNTLAADDTSCNMFALATGNLRLDWVSGNVSATFAFAVGAYYDISCTRRRATVNGTVLTGTNTASVNTTGPFLIGNFYNDDAPYSTGFKGKIFYTKLYDEDVLVRDLVPCYRKADDKPGMYDLVHDVFYTNAGTGEFSVGGDV